MGSAKIAGASIVLFMVFAAAVASSTEQQKFVDNPLLEGDSNMTVKLHLTGLGTDYLFTFAGGDPYTVWETNGWAGSSYGVSARSPGYHTSELGFVFSGLTGQSILDFDKMDEVITILASHGLKVILSFQNNNQAASEYVANSGFITNWVAIANHYKESSLRGYIAAYSILGEPNEYVRNQYASKQLMEDRFAYCIQQIHAVDSTMPCIYPDGDLNYDTCAEWITNVQNTGITSDDYVYYDCVHPYYFPVPYESYNMGLTPTQKASWYSTNWIEPAVTAFGAAKTWSGETFHWGGDSLYDEEQSEWLTAIINQFYANQIGFSVWSWGGDGTAGAYLSLEDIDASNYKGTVDEAKTKTLSFDAWIEGTRPRTLTVDSWLKLEQTKEFTLDGYPIKVYTKALTFDAWLQKEYAKTFTLGGIPWTMGAFNFDADLLATYTKTFTLDGWLRLTTPGTFTFDGIPLGRKGQFSFDGFLAWWTATVSRLGFIENVISEMQKQNIGDYCFEAGCVEPGCDNMATPIRRAAVQMREAKT